MYRRQSKMGAISYVLIFCAKGLDQFLQITFWVHAKYLRRLPYMAKWAIPDILSSLRACTGERANMGFARVEGISYGALLYEALAMHFYTQTNNIF